MILMTFYIFPIAFTHPNSKVLSKIRSEGHFPSQCQRIILKLDQDIKVSTSYGNGCVQLDPALGYRNLTVVDVVTLVD